MRNLFRLSLAALLFCGAATPVSASPDDHASALAALADVRASVAEIVRIEDGYAVGHGAYLRAAHRAMNALVGRRDDGYVARFGDPGDGVGTLGHLDRMLDQTGTSVWTPAVQGAKANVLAAAENVQSALGEKQMEDYQADLTRALASIALVVGRPSEAGVLGGLSGALANTSLAVPAGGTSTSGCAEPTRTPAYGVVSGRLAYIALSRAAAATALPDESSISRVVVRGDRVLLYTHASSDVLRSCRAVRTQSRAVPSRIGRARVVRSRAAASGGNAASYTIVQARAGARIYQRYCLQCHGTDLQGTAGPAVAGNDFLSTAKRNTWTLSDLRTTVVQNMPFSNPGSLTPTQYANVLAFLLASNCYPAGPVPFPQTERPAFAKTKIGPVPGAKPGNAKLGSCSVK